MFYYFETFIYKISSFPCSSIYVARQKASLRFVYTM